MSEWSEKNSSQTSLSILWFCKPFGIKRNKFVINFRENSKKFIIEILTKNIALNLSGAFFFIGIGYSLKWWYKDQLFVILLKQNLPVFSEPEHKISWETGEYALNKIKEQQKRLAEKNKNVPTFHIFDMTSVPSSASSFEGGVINKINSKLHKPLENYLLEEELSINSLQMHDNKSIDFYAKQSFATDKDKSSFAAFSNSAIEKYIDSQTRFVSQAAWFSRSIDCQNLTGKRVVVFGDGTHAASITKILAREMGIRVSCAGTYCRHDADWFREQIEGFCDEILITEDHTQVGDMIARVEPAAIFGTQMERHIGKRLDIPCGVISAPVHIQNFPLGYRPFLGYEGTNQIADLVYNSFTLGMEDHLLEIFGGHDTKEVITKALSNQDSLNWAPDGIAELSKIPGFVRGKVKRNTEKFARENNITEITVEVMYGAKEAAGG